MERELFADDFEPCCECRVRRVRDYKQYIMNGHLTGAKHVTATHYECDTCGKPAVLKIAKADEKEPA